MTVDDYSALLPLLNLIADGEVHSGVDLARRLGVSRAAVCKRVKKLADLELLPGMPVEAFIKTGDRTPMAYLLKPFTDYFQKAFRET